MAFGLVSRVDGSIFSMVGSLLRVTRTEAQEDKTEKNFNSQNMELPKPDSVLENDPSLQKDIGTAMIEGRALISEAGPLGTSADIKEERPSSDQISVYIVRPGDNLSEIAKMYDVSINTIRWANDLKKDSVIKEGDTLVILPIPGIRYTVKKGDTIQSIAKKYSGDADEIMTYNGIESNKLVVGETIIIPDGEMIITPTVKSAPKAVSGSKASGSSTAGYYMRPISGGVKSQGIHGHNAVDLAAPIGTPIYASASGRVIVAKSSGWNGGYGNYIVISHPNGTQTLYSHNSAVYVSVGQYVDKGDVIGTIGSTGRSTGPHLHFEIRGATNPF